MSSTSTRLAVHAAVAVVTTVTALLLAAAEEEEQRNNHNNNNNNNRQLPTTNRLKRKRGKRRVFDSHGAYKCIKRDFLSPYALFGKEFIMIFRLSRSRVQRLLEDFGKYAERNVFFQTFRMDKAGRIGPSLEAKVLLPLKVLAYGVAPHTFCDYFSMSKPMARECFKQFLDAMTFMYSSTYLGLPTASDLRNILALHKRVHDADGMLGSLDCMQTQWKNCPLAWQQSFKGRAKGMATVTLEAACDYNLWFWHAAYGFSGALNDTNVLALSPLLDRMTNGSFTEFEQEAGVVPYRIGNIDPEPFNKTYFLVDGIYPRYTRFVKGMTSPMVDTDQRFTAWQESARKDIERAFGVLQCRFKAMASPIHLMDCHYIYSQAAVCLMMHNMCVQERVMGNCTDRYDPSVESDPEVVATVLRQQTVETVAVLGKCFPPSLNLFLRPWL